MRPRRQGLQVSTFPFLAVLLSAMGSLILVLLAVDQKARAAARAKVEPGDGVNAPPTTPYQGLDHFGLTVKDIDAVAAEIKAKGVEFTKEPTTIRPGVRVCFVRGPQGISIELLERDAKYA